jgi:hypothetical protein
VVAASPSQGLIYKSSMLREFMIRFLGEYFTPTHRFERSGEILAATRCANAISCSAVDGSYVHFVTTGDDKKLSVWRLSTMQLMSSR